MANREVDQAYAGINHKQTAIVIENQAAGLGEAIGDQTERPAVCHGGRGIAKGQSIGAVSSEDHAGQSCQGKEWQCALHHGVRWAGTGWRGIEIRGMGIYARGKMIHDCS
ncbi:unnamed protein product [Clonostachys solani]|uniref:Uncharacterized protein n=1 Tax=Clonostachys solani TaxID=160281 RepID=A0A9P0EH88_9HYPO|nr:unnamed protein product [Clonostachys solani]